MNGWYFGANDAARQRLQHFRHQAEQDGAARRALAREPRHGALHRARNRAAATLHRLADALAPSSMGSSTDGLAGRSHGRPVG